MYTKRELNLALEYYLDENPDLLNLSVQDQLKAACVEAFLYPIPDQEFASRVGHDLEKHIRYEHVIREAAVDFFSFGRFAWEKQVA